MVYNYYTCMYSLSVLYKKIYSASVVYTILSQSVLTKLLVYDAEIHNNASVLVLLLVVPCGWFIQIRSHNIDLSVLAKK